jgi:hypothetical protein
MYTRSSPKVAVKKRNLVLQPLVMLAVCGSPAVGVGAESGAQGLGHHGGVRVAAEEGLLRRRGRWPAFGREGAPSGLLVPLLHVKIPLSVSRHLRAELSCPAVSAP